MYLGSDAANFALLLARVWVAIMIFAHGWRHVKAIQSGPGMANWFESLGPQARTTSTPDAVTLTEVAIPIAARARLPHAALLRRRVRADGGGAPHQPPQERLLPRPAPRRATSTSLTVAVLSITLGTLGPGKWSLDHAFDFTFPFDPKKALIITAIVGIGGTARVPGRVLAPTQEGLDRRLTAATRTGGTRTMGRVALEHVSKRFDDVAAVDDLTLEVADEEFLVLLGPSGCGKSTALRMIAGLEDPTSGTITIGDRVVNDVEAKDRDISMVFQSYALYPHMTVRRNIEFPLRSRKVPSAERAQLVQRGGREPRSRRAARPQARAAVRRATPAGRARACDRAAPAGVPHGRAALEPRRQAAGADPRRAGRAATAARRPRSSTSPTTRSRR